jgi:23S rRNA pseudouridine1911/1915/1917 synthase
VAGDPVYGGNPKGISGPDRAWAQQFAKRLPRQFLHAAELQFTHPTSGAVLRFESSLPAGLAEAAEWARQTSRPS